MAYVKKDWQDLPSQTTPVTADDLDRIENGIEYNDQRLNGTSVAGEMIVDSIRSKNMFDKSTLIQGDIQNLNPTIRLSSRQILWLNVGTYTFSSNKSNSYDFDIVTQHIGIPPLTSQPSFDYNSGWKNENSLTFTISTAGWFTIYLRRSDNGTFTSTDLTNLKSYNYQLETGATATNYMPYQKLDGMETYLTEEQVIGTWLGKPLYRKVYITNTYSTTNNISISNVKEIIDVKGKIQRSDYQDIYQTIPGRTNNTNFYAQFNNITVSQNLVSVAIEFGSSLQNSIKEIAIILEYTKTTD